MNDNEAPADYQKIIRENKELLAEGRENDFAAMRAEVKVMSRGQLQQADEFLQRARSSNEDSISLCKENIEAIDAVRKLIAKRLVNPGL